MLRRTGLFLAAALVFACSGLNTWGFEPPPPPAPPANGFSVELGRSAETVGQFRDYLVSPSVPAGGVLFSAWTKIPVGWNNFGHNMDVFVLKGSNWNIRFLVANIEFNYAFYNANSMVFLNDYDNFWGGDYSFWSNTKPSINYPLTTAQMTGWVWAAWQVVVDAGNSTLTINQWLKFGSGGSVIAAGSDTIPFSELRSNFLDPSKNSYWNPPGAGYSDPSRPSDAEISAWVPTDAVSLQVGRDCSNMFHVRVEGWSDPAGPGLPYLESLSKLNAPDPTAWADWELAWTASGPSIKDRSGHGRDLTVPAGSVPNRGQAAPQP